MAEKKFLSGTKADIPLVGTDDEIKTQVSLLLGVEKLLEIENKGLDLDFYKFIDLFEEGFNAGFGVKQNPGLNLKYWGQKIKSRPRIKVILESSKTWQKKGYAVVELLPNRTIEKESYLLFGTQAQLIQQCMYWMNLHRKLTNLEVNAESSGGIRKNSFPPKFKQSLELTFYWSGVTESTGKNHRVEKSVRLIGVNPRTVTLKYLRELGIKVLNKFDNLMWKTGHVKAKYSKWDDGFHTWGYFESESTAYRIIESMADIVAKSIDKEQLRYERSAAPSEAFKPTGEKITLANKSVRVKATAPIAPMKFYAASVTFPYIGHTEKLCNTSGYLIQSLAFLDAYDE